MNAEVHILCFNEADILPYTLRHYASFCDRITIHDAMSTDKSREIAVSFGALVEDWVTDGVNDQLAKQLKDRCVMASKFGWCIVADADELIYFPDGAGYTLGSYDAQGVAVVRPFGWEMVSDHFPTTDMQIYDEVKFGGRDDKWYAKPILSSPKRLRSISYEVGAHSCIAILADGSQFRYPQQPTTPPTYLLHFHQIGPVSRIAARYARQQARHSEINNRMRWGNFDDPMKHAMDKRAMITAKLEQVIP